MGKHAGINRLLARYGPGVPEIDPMTLLLLLAGCDLLPTAEPPPAPPPPAPMTAQASPADKAPGGPGGRSLVAASATVTNPTSGANLAVYVSTPTTGTGPWPTLVVVPGGFQAGMQNMPPDRQTPYLETGFALVVWDPDGRGNSTGTEDRGGAIHQDGLKAVIDWAKKDSRVDPNRLGVMTFSFGITIGAGTLARFQDTGAKFLLDWEGPANRNYTHGCGTQQTGQPETNDAIEAGWGECTDDVYWQFREGSTSIKNVTVPYLRVQFQKDHVQPTHQHAVDMMVAAQSGGNAWTRINDEPVNKRITSEADFTTLSNTKPQPFVMAHYAKEMMELTTKQTVVGNEPAMPERPAGGRPGGQGGGGRAPGQGGGRPPGGAGGEGQRPQRP